MSPEAMQRLAALNAAGPTSVYMTGEEGQELVTAGYIQPDPMQVGPVPGSCRVMITQAGINALTPAPPMAQQIESHWEIATNVPLKKKGHSKNLKPAESKYPFDELPEPFIDPVTGGPCFPSFHVKATPENPKPWVSLTSCTKNANAKAMMVERRGDGQPVMETVKARKLVKDAEGKPVLDANGKRQFNEVEVLQEKKTPVKLFISRRADAKDPCGVGVRVFRVPVDYCE